MNIIRCDYCEDIVFNSINERIWKVYKEINNRIICEDCMIDHYAEYGEN